MCTNVGPNMSLFIQAIIGDEIVCPMVLRFSLNVVCCSANSSTDFRLILLR